MPRRAGAVQHELAPMADFPGEHFTIVAARGDDVWAEIRRAAFLRTTASEDLFVPTHAARLVAVPIEELALEIQAEAPSHGVDTLPPG